MGCNSKLELRLSKYDTNLICSVINLKHRASVRTGSKHSLKQDRSSSSGSHHSSSHHSGSVRKPSRQSSIRSSGGSVRGSFRGSVSVPGTKTSFHDSSSHSLTDDTSLYITPMIQPLSQTDSVLNTKVSYFCRTALVSFLAVENSVLQQCEILGMEF